MSRGRRLQFLLAGIALLAAGCGGDDEATTTTLVTSTTSTPLPTTTTTTIVPQGEILVGQGDSGPLVRFLQFLLQCNGYESVVVDGRDEGIVVDGVYGAVTGAFVEAAQEDLGYRPDSGGASGDVLLALGSTCSQARSLAMPAQSMQIRVEAYLSANVTDRVEVRAADGQTITILADQPMTLGVTAPSGTVISSPASTTQVVVEAAETGGYVIEASATSEGLYGYVVEIPPPPSALVLQSTGLDFVDFGDPADDVIETLTVILGPPTDDSGWTDAGGVCVNHRLVTFGDGELVVDFTDAAADITDAATYAAAGTQHFAAWEASLPHTDPTQPLLPRLETPSGLGVGDPASAVAEIYADRVEVTETGFSILEGIITGEIGPGPAAGAGEDTTDDTTGDTTDDTTDGGGEQAEDVVLTIRAGAQLCEDQD